MITEQENLLINRKANKYNKINKNLQGGIILEDGIYGKCILPNSIIKINNNDISIENFIVKKILKKKYDYSFGLEKWFSIRDEHNYYIKSFNHFENKI